MPVLWVWVSNGEGRTTTGSQGISLEGDNSPANRRDMGVGGQGYIAPYEQGMLPSCRESRNALACALFGRPTCLGRGEGSRVLRRQTTIGGSPKFKVRPENRMCSGTPGHGTLFQ